MLEAGFARVDVTPPLGTPVMGYFEKRYAEGILDPLELNALAVRSGEDTVVIITGDFTGVPRVEALRYRGLIAEETGLPIECIFYQSVHQHTSAKPGKNAWVDELYQEMLCRKFCDVAKMAISDLSDAHLSFAEGEPKEPVAFVRRFRMKDGTTRTNPGCLNPDIDHALDVADNTVRLVKFQREGKKDIALVGFQNHPDMIGGRKLSADWPGFVRRMTEERIPDVHCILVNGCQGDVNHYDVTRENPAKGHKKNTPEWLELRYAFCRKVGAILTDAVVDLWDRTETVEAEGVYAKEEVKFFMTRFDGVERMEECKALYKSMMAGGPEAKLPLDDRGEISRIAHLDEKDLYMKIPVSLVAFGKIAILGYGGEPFTEYAVKVRESVPEIHLLTACLANGSEGYLPSVSAFGEGGYEARSTNFPPELPTVLQDTAKKMLAEYLGK